MLFVLQLTVDISFHKFQAAFVQLLQKGQHCTKDIFVPIVVVLRRLIPIIEAIVGARSLSGVMRLVVCWIEWYETTSVCQVIVIVPGNRLDASISVGHLLAARTSHLVLTIIVCHVIGRRL